MTPPGVTVLPLEVWQQPGGVILRCMCGTEPATLRRGTVNASMTGLRGSGPSRARLAPDMTPAGLLMMAAHALTCERGRQVLEERAMSSRPGTSRPGEREARETT